MNIEDYPCEWTHWGDAEHLLELRREVAGCNEADTVGNLVDGELDDDKQEAYSIYIDGGLGEEYIDSFNDAYMGKYDSEEDYAYEIINECYNIEQMMGGLSSYFDYKAYARDLFIDDYYFDNSHVFRRG